MEVCRERAEYPWRRRRHSWRTSNRVLVDANGAAPQLVDAIDIPVIGVKAKERVDVLAIRTWIAQHAPQHAFIERAQAMPKQGASSGFKYGRAVGSIEAVIECCGIPLTIVEPTAWKNFTGCARATKRPVGSVHGNCFKPRMRCSPSRNITVALKPY
jgi:Holliday junction resolvasome RuvABC endonuclease subunit